MGEVKSMIHKLGSVTQGKIRPCDCKFIWNSFDDTKCVKPNYVVTATCWDPWILSSSESNHLSVAFTKSAMSGQETCNLRHIPRHRCGNEASLAGAIKLCQTPIDPMCATTKVFSQHTCNLHEAGWTTQLYFNHRDWCGVCGALERERASSSEHAATFVKMSGGAWNHTHEWQLLGLNMGLNGKFCFLFLLYYIPCFIVHHKNCP